MICDDIRARYLDNDFELSDIAVAVEIAEHMSDCKACRQAAKEYDELRHTLKAADNDYLADLPIPELPPLELELGSPEDLAPAQPAPAKPNKRYRYIWPMSQVAILLFAVIGWGLYLSSRKHQVSVVSRIAESSPTSSVSKDENSADQSKKETLATVPPVMPADLQWSRAEVIDGAALFNNVSESFDGHAAWVAVGKQTNEVGLSKRSIALPPKVLLVRLLMEQAEQSPSKTDLLIIPGQEVSVQVPFQLGEVLYYRIKTTSGHQPRLTLAAEVRSKDDGETLAAMTTQLQPQVDKALLACKLQSQSGPYYLDVSFSETALASIH